MATPRRRSRGSRTRDPRTELIANQTCVVGNERAIVRMQSSDIPALVFPRTEVAVFERGLSVRRDAVATRRNRVCACEPGCERAGRTEKIFA